MVIAVSIFPRAARILRELKRGLIFRFGTFPGPKGPGLMLLIPVLNSLLRL